jgi:hypothetical protein
LKHVRIFLFSGYRLLSGFIDFLIGSWSKDNGKLVRILETVASNLYRILIFLGFTLLARNCRILKKKVEILARS